MMVVFLTAVVCGKFSGKCYVNNFTHISTPPLRTSSSKFSRSILYEVVERRLDDD